MALRLRRLYGVALGFDSALGRARRNACGSHHGSEPAQNDSPPMVSHGRDSNSISIADASTKDEFLDTMRPRIWIYNTPLPYHVYIRVLYELFDQEEINTLKNENAKIVAEFLELKNKYIQIINFN